MTNNIFELMQGITINFAEWLSENEWYKQDKKHVLYYSNITCEYKTIDELYELFMIHEKGRLNTLYKNKN